MSLVIGEVSGHEHLVTRGNQVQADIQTFRSFPKDPYTEPEPESDLMGYLPWNVSASTLDPSNSYRETEGEREEPYANLCARTI